MASRTRPAERRPRISARAVAVSTVCAAAVVLFATLVPIQTVLYGTPLALSFLLGAGLCVAPLLALSHPRWAIALFTASVFMLPLFVEQSSAITAPWPWPVPAQLTFVLLIAVVTFGHGARLGAFALVIGAVVSLTAPLLRPDIVATGATAASAAADLIVTASIGAGAYLLAVLVAGRLRVSAELSSQRELTALEQSRRALVEERTRIARELHDVIAHSMSLIQVQASTARYRLPELPADAADEFDGIAGTARASLTEMRRLLGVLRTEDQAAELAPQHGIDDIPALVDSIRRAGVAVGLELVGGADRVPAGVQIAAYRIVQECLSNAVRHAAGAAVMVKVRTDADAVLLHVSNSSAASTAASSGGHGLRGMRERAEILGGSLTAGPLPAGGWSVDAELPFHTSEETA